MKIQIIGGGLAGSEAAWQVAQRGIEVDLYEMRPQKQTKAHRSGLLGELVCSNSLRGASLTNAVGLLKEELRLCCSLIMEAADYAQVPAGGALAVDREIFSNYIDKKVKDHPLITVHTTEICDIPNASSAAPVIVASGPLTSPGLAQTIRSFLGTASLSFFDAISPIITSDSIQFEKLFRQSRYNKGSGSDYWNIPLSKEEYYAFVDALRNGEKFGGHEEIEADEVDNLRPFEGCMPIESMVDRGPDTLLFGPMKPTGLVHPETNVRPYAVVQLRQDNKAATLWSMVGFQTKLKHPEQKRIFSMLPGLEKAEFVRLGSVHRNTFINSPQCLNASNELRTQQGLFFAGQMTGVEGYVESTASGLVAGINASRRMRGLEPIVFPTNTATGALLNYISDPLRTDFQPMNVSFGLMPEYVQVQSEKAQRKKMSKADRRTSTSLHALEEVSRLLLSNEEKCLTK